jgi:hypothetical protein
VKIRLALVCAFKRRFIDGRQVGFVVLREVLEALLLLAMPEVELIERHDASLKFVDPLPIPGAWIRK